MTSDHYGVLGLTKSASNEDIHRAYRTLAFQFHPDRNSAADAAARMVAINHAYEVLGDPRSRREYDDRISRPIPGNELSAAILLAARDVILRSGWRVLEDYSRTLLLESAKQRVRIVFTDRLDVALMSRVCREPSELTVVLAVFVDPSIDPSLLRRSPSTIVLDLIRSGSYGELPEGACRSLLAPFL